MARPVDAAVEAAYTADPYRQTVFSLCELYGASTYRFTDAPIPIIWGGFTWQNIWFRQSELVVDGEGELSCSIVFEDASRTLRSLAFSENLSDKEIRISEVWANTDNTLFGQDMILHGLCDGFRAEGEQDETPMAQLSIRSIFSASAVAIGPTQDYTRNCRYREFKGAQCKYAGGVTFCDRTYTTCLALLNTINFGGFRFALSDGDVIKWGTGLAQRATPRRVPAYQPPPSGGGTGVTDPISRDPITPLA